MYFSDLSNSRSIGANCYLMTIENFNFIIDCGINPKKIGYQSIPSLSSIPLYQLDFIIITHCHLDHIGALPLLHKQQIQSPIFLSIPSYFLAPTMMKSTFFVMKKQKMENHILEYPLYTLQDIKNCKKNLVPIPYLKKIIIKKNGKSLIIILYPSGHIPGNCGILIIYNNSTVFFSSDIFFKNQRMIKGAISPLFKYHTLILESTKGNLHNNEKFNRETEEKKLIQAINYTYNQGGSILIPIFALGRMQEILYLIIEAQNKKLLKKNMKIYCNGLGMKLIDCFNKIRKKTQLINFSKEKILKLNIKNFQYNTSNIGKDLKTQGLYIITSGMLIPKTPSFYLASSLLENKKNLIAFVGYCDPKSPGGKLQKTYSRQLFYFEKINYYAYVLCSIKKFDLSAHASQEELIYYAIQKKPKSIILIHGNTEAKQYLNKVLKIKNKKLNIIIPIYGKKYYITSFKK